MNIDTKKDREIVEAADCPIKMIEIYSGKDEQWAGWHNLLVNDEGGTCIAGPLTPEQSAPLLELISAAEERDDLRLKYDELIMAVETKHPNQSRHETALKYIRWMEAPKDGSKALSTKRGG